MTPLATTESPGAEILIDNAQFKLSPERFHWYRSDVARDRDDIRPQRERANVKVGPVMDDTIYSTSNSQASFAPEFFSGHKTFHSGRETFRLCLWSLGRSDPKS